MTKQLIQQLEELGDAREYDKQAEAFLTATGTTLEFKRASIQTRPLWGDEKSKNIKYSVLLKNKRGEYAFDFWGCQRDAELFDKADLPVNTQKHDAFVSEVVKLAKEKGVAVSMYAFKFSSKATLELLEKITTPSAYSILASLSVMSARNFDEFCDEYGYDKDSRTAERTYHAMLEQEKGLNSIFDRDEVEALGYIN